MRFLSAWVAAGALALVACGGTSSNESPADGGSSIGNADATVGLIDAGTTPLPCDVDAVMQARCRSCHQNPPLSGAPMPLTSWESVHVPSRTNASIPVFQAIKSRIHDDASPMPQAPNPRLTDAEAKTIDDWVAAGAPAATTCIPDAGAAPDAAGPTIGCTPNLDIAPATPWAMPTTTDDQYVCYGFDAPAGSIPSGTSRHVLGITPKVVNNQIVHHVLLYQADATVSPTPTACNPTGSIKWRVVYAWAPGGGSMQTPPDVGFPYDQTTHWVVQVHYNNVTHLANQTDTSGFSLCTTDQAVKYDADVVAFGSQKFDVPPHGSTDITCSVSVPFTGLHMFSAFPHMHKLGTAIETKLYPSGGGAAVDMGSNKPWNFNNQLWFPVTGTINSGDVVKTRCAWTNPTGTDVGFGQNTEDEMCYSFTAYYPKITSPVWAWDLPALQASCTPSADGGL